VVDGNPCERIGGDLMAAEAKEIVFRQEVQFVDVGLETEVAGAEVGLGAIGVGGSDLSDGEIGKQ
jgi:hypothetical protein